MARGVGHQGPVGVVEIVDAELEDSSSGWFVFLFLVITPSVIIFMREIRNSSVMTRLVLMKFWPHLIFWTR